MKTALTREEYHSTTTICLCLKSLTNYHQYVILQYIRALEKCQDKLNEYRLQGLKLVSTLVDAYINRKEN